MNSGSPSESNETWKSWWPDLYSQYGEPTQYPGGSASYIKAGKFLYGPGQVEEWGCATTWGKQFIASPYRGVDGAPSQWVDEVADLSTYTSDSQKILIRHVLEHNWNWRSILQNVIDSFTDRAVVVLFIPPGRHDINRSFNHVAGERETPPGLQLDEESLDWMLCRPDISVETEDLTNNTPPFGYERIYYLRRGERESGRYYLTPRCTVGSCSNDFTGLIRIDYEVLGNRFEYQIRACQGCQDEFHRGLYSLERVPDLLWE